MPLSRRVIRSTTTIAGAPPPPPPPPPPPGGGISKLFVVGDSIALGGWRLILPDLIQARTGTKPTLYSYAMGGTRLGTAAQMAGVSMTGTVVGGQIPASGAVQWKPSDPEFDLGESGSGTAAIPGMSLAGVTGTIRRPGGRHSDPITFTRDTTGQTVPAGGTQPLIHLSAVARRSDSVLVVCSGHNNRLDALRAYPDHALGQPYIPNTITAIMNYWLGPNFVLGLTSGPTVPERLNGDPAAGYDQDYLDAFGTTGYGGAVGDMRAAATVANWVDVRAGLLNTSTDPDLSAYTYNNIAITADITTQTGPGKRYPHYPSIRVDMLGHHTNAGHRWYAKQIYDKFIEQGLI